MPILFKINRHNYHLKTVYTIRQTVGIVNFKSKKNQILMNIQGLIKSGWWQKELDKSFQSKVGQNMLTTI